MYRVFEALDELVTIIEEARGVPMTSNCIVPRGDSLELLDEIRDAIPGELDDAQDVLDKRDELVGKAEHDAATKISKANADAESTLANANAEAERLLAEAHARAERMISEAEQQADREVEKGHAEYEELVGRAHAEAERMLQAGRESYEHAVEDGRVEQARMVSQTEVVQAAHVEASRILEATAAEADRQRTECDAYVDGKLAEFEDLLAYTLRTVGKGRTHLRATQATGVHTPNPHVQAMPVQNNGAAPYDYEGQ